MPPTAMEFDADTPLGMLPPTPELAWPAVVGTDCVALGPLVLVLDVLFICLFIPLAIALAMMTLMIMARAMTPLRRPSERAGELDWCIPRGCFGSGPRLP